MASSSFLKWIYQNCWIFRDEETAVCCGLGLQEDSFLCQVEMVFKGFCKKITSFYDLYSWTVSQTIFKQKNIKCRVTSVYIVNSNLRSKRVNKEFFTSLGLCSEPIKEITFRKSSLHNLTIGDGMENLKKLDLRFNDVDIINRPNVELK